MILSYFDNCKIGPTVLFIHGTASAKEVWDRQFALLTEKNFRVIGVDLRGHGHSINPGGGCSLHDHVSDVKETLDFIGITEHITIVGHSFGAVVALRLAELNPMLVTKLLLVSLPPKVPELLHRYYKWFLGKPIELIKKSLGLILKLPLKRKHKIAFKTDINVIRQIWKDSMNWDFLLQVPRVKCAVYLSVGKFDYIARYRMVQRLHHELPNSTFKVFNFAAHTCMEDQPKEFNTWILNVLGLPLL